MKNLFVIMLYLMIATGVSACGTDNNTVPEVPEQPGNNNGENETDEENDMENNTIKLTAGNKTFTASLANNSSAKALKELLTKGDITIDMSDYANMEKVGPLGTTLPRNDERITTGAGDLILYQGTSFVIYYAPNTYSFTRLGKIENTTREELLAALGSGDITVTLSIN